MNEWGWQDEAWRLDSGMRAQTYSSDDVIANLARLRAEVSVQGRLKPPFPPEDDDGGSGVREPRRPLPHAPAGSAALALTFA